MKSDFELKLDDDFVESEKAAAPWEKFKEQVLAHRLAVGAGILGLTLLVLAASSFASGLMGGDKVEVLPFDSAQGKGVLSAQTQSITVEIAGQVQKPGVYTLNSGSRIEQLLIASGGLSAGADRAWVDKNLNRAAKLVDGQKIYIPKVGESTVYGLQSTANSGSKAVVRAPFQGESTVSRLVNINTASLKELDNLPGIGSVRAQAIINNRPYSSIEELVSKKAITKSVLEKIRDKITL